jgi:hypothetical protein
MLILVVSGLMDDNGTEMPAPIQLHEKQHAPDLIMSRITEQFSKLVRDNLHWTVFLVICSR